MTIRAHPRDANRPRFGLKPHTWMTVVDIACRYQGTYHDGQPGYDWPDGVAPTPAPPKLWCFYREIHEQLEREEWDA